MTPIFFPHPTGFRAWLEEHHAGERELLVGFYKKGTGRPSMTWPESVDEALCFGWIDGIRKRIDEESYSIRFTPRKARSTWSAVNIQRVQVLTAGGLMRPAGITAFEARSDDNSVIYAYEQRPASLPEEYEARFRERAGAWEFFQAKAQWYRRNATWWVISAKREETRLKRLATLIDDSAEGRTIAHLTRSVD